MMGRSRSRVSTEGELEFCGFGAHADDFHGYVYEIGTYHFNWHKKMELLIIVRGSVEVCAAGKARVCHPGDMVLINPNQGHATLSLEPGGLALALHFDPSVLTAAGSSASVFASQPSGDREGVRAQRSIRGLLAAMMLRSLDGPAAELKLGRDFYDLLIAICDAFPLLQPCSEPWSVADGLDARAPLPDRGNATIGKVCAYVEQHYREHITLSQLSRVGGYNPTYLSEMFGQEIGISCFDYLTRVRVREATKDLAQRERRISDIALDNGFSDAKAFSTAFRRSFGKPPSEYRKQLPGHADAKLFATVDSRFKKRFVPRTDLAATAVLTGWFNDAFPADGRQERLASLRQGLTHMAEQVQEFLGELEELEPSGRSSDPAAAQRMR